VLVSALTFDLMGEAFERETGTYAIGWVSAVLALAAGGILALLADTMFPEVFEHGGRWVAWHRRGLHLRLPAQ
jgi:uncharacterized membrane protein